MADKEERRKQRNREAAHRSYRRRKTEQRELERKLEEAELKQIRLNREIQQLKSQAQAYENVVRRITHVCHRHRGPGSSSTGGSGPSSSSGDFHQASSSGADLSSGAAQAGFSGPSSTQAEQTSSSSAQTYDITKQAGSTGPFSGQQTSSGSVLSHNITTKTQSTGPAQFLLSRSRNSVPSLAESAACVSPLSGVGLAAPAVSHTAACPPVLTLASHLPEQASQRENATKDLILMQPTSQQFESVPTATGSRGTKPSHQLSATLCSTAPADVSATVTPLGLCDSGASTDGNLSLTLPSLDLLDLLTDFDIHQGPSSSVTTVPARNLSHCRHNNAFEVADEFITSLTATPTSSSAEDTSQRSKPQVSLHAEDILTIAQSQPDDQNQTPTAGLFNRTSCADSTTIGWVMEVNKTHDDTVERNLPGRPLYCSESSLPFLHDASLITATAGYSSGFNTVNPGISLLDLQQGSSITNFTHAHGKDGMKHAGSKTTVSHAPSLFSDLYDADIEPSTERTPPCLIRTKPTHNTIHHEDDANCPTEIPKSSGRASFCQDITGTGGTDMASDLSEKCGDAAPPRELFRGDNVAQGYNKKARKPALRPADVNVKLKKKYQ